MDYPLIKPKYYYSLFLDIVNFVRRPTIEENLVKSTKIKIFDTIGLFVVKILLLIPISMIIGFIHDPENLTKSDMAERFSPIALIFVTVIILPFLEELCFRLSLKFKPLYLAVSLGILGYYLFTKAVYQTKVSAVDESFLTRTVFALGLVIVLYPILNISSIKTRLSRFWNDHFRGIFYLSCIAFAWVHIFNYELTWINIAILPLITLPQLLTGFISGYTIVAFGFQYPLLFHMATNLIAVGITFLPFAD